jgi:translation initiation factor 4A
MGDGQTSEYFTDWNESFESFDQMSLHENLLRGIYAYGAWWLREGTHS